MPKISASCKKASCSRIYGAFAMSSPWSSLIFRCQIDNFQQSGGAPDCQNGPTDRFRGVIRIRARNARKNSTFTRDSVVRARFCLEIRNVLLLLQAQGDWKRPRQPHYQQPPFCNNRHFDSVAPPSAVIMGRHPIRNRFYRHQPLKIRLVSPLCLCQTGV